MLGIFKQYVSELSYFQQVHLTPNKDFWIRLQKNSAEALSISAEVLQQTTLPTYALF
jgi:hypothetical protein